MYEHDNTLFLENSIDWEMDLRPCESKTITQKDGEKATVYYYNVRRKKDAPYRTDHPEYDNKNLLVHRKTIIELKHQVGLVDFIVLRVEVRTYYVKELGKAYHCQDLMPFKDPNGRYTHHYRESVERSLKGYCMTIKRCSILCNTTPTIARAINKNRLMRQAGDMRATLADNIKHIAVDEFLLHENRMYCTIAICAETGKLLFLEPGKKKGQIAHMMDWLGDAFMRKIETVSMDMNTNYASAIQDSIWKYPNLKIVYDKFHIIKKYNEDVINTVRKQEINRLSEKMAEAKAQKDDEKYLELLKARTAIKSGAMLLLANRQTLKARDSINQKINKKNLEDGVNGSSLYSVTKRRTDSEERYKQILDSNEMLQNVCRLREELQAILNLYNEDELSRRLDAWIEEAKQYNNAALSSFARTMKSRKEGIITKAKCHLENGKLEGVNSFIKALRRASFGLPDFDYFALLIWEQCEDMRRRALENKKRTVVNRATKEHKVTKGTTRDFTKRTVFDWKNNKALDASPIREVDRIIF